MIWPLINFDGEKSERGGPAFHSRPLGMHINIISELIKILQLGPIIYQKLHESQIRKTIVEFINFQQ